MKHDEYGCCCTCKHQPINEWEEPCCNCQNNFVNGTPEFMCHDLLWEHPDSKPSDPVTHPSHYTQGNIQCIDAMEAAFGKEAVATWSKLNAFKYIWRAVHKNGMEDIDKAIWYLNKYKELKSDERTEAV